jgi:putative ABC transport system permease protein
MCVWYVFKYPISKNRLMIKNFIITAWRNLGRNKVFSFINVFGLAIGLACCMLITAYLYSELTYDTYAANARQIYRVALHSNGNNTAADFPNVDVAVGSGIKNAFPEVIASTRLTNRGPVFVKYNGLQFKEEKIVIIDSNFFQFFSIPLLDGDTKTALTEPKSLVITRAFQKKYFGSSPAIGKMILVGNDLVKEQVLLIKFPKTPISMQTLL